MLLSKKLPGIRLIPVELEIVRKTAAERAKTLQEFVTPGPARDAKLPGVSDMDFNLVAFLEFERFDHGGGKADREAVSPLGDLHSLSMDIHLSECISMDDRGQALSRPFAVLLLQLERVRKVKKEF
jgi:hypothetical protein